MNPVKRPLVLVSNAEPYAHRWEEDEIVCEKLAGGLTSALDPLMQESGGLWIAWGRGEADSEVLNSEGKVKVPDDEGYTLKRLELSDEEVDGFYLGFSNGLLWPICHSFPERTELEDYHTSEDNWRTYEKVNQRYADAVTEELEEEDLIWVHDYHLALVPKMIKEKFPEADIGFFWHIPWPSWEIFGNIPWRSEIMEGLLSSDFIGFHTPSLKKNFLSCVKKTRKTNRDEKSAEKMDEKMPRISAIPISINYDWFSSLSKEEKYREKARDLENSIKVENIILGMDRLDYTKGIPERLRAYELFLKEYPEFQGKVTLVQRIPPSRTSAKEYQSILNRINRIIGEINGRFEKAEWTPIKSFHRFLPKQEGLIPYYMVADVALVTPLIDGMNLVSKEYVASTADGVLMLSEFAGAAEELEEALHVNPYNTREVAQGIKTALEMDKDERRNRLKKLKERVKKKDLDWWREKFLKKWLEACEDGECQ